MSEHLDCNQVRSQLPDLFGNELDAAARRAIEEHAAACANCAREIADWSEVHGVLHRVTHPASQNSIRPQPQTPATQAKPATLNRWRLAAGIAIVFSAGVLVGRIAPSGPTMTTVAEAGVAAPTLIDRYRQASASSPGAGSLGHALLSMARR